MRALYLVRLEKVVDITSEEEEAIYEHAEMLDGNQEPWLSEDFFTDSDSSEDRKQLEVKVSPESFKALKELAEKGETFVIC